MATRKIVWVMAVAIGAVALGGCANNQVSNSSMSQNDLDRLNAEKNKFEMQDRPISVDTRLAAGELAESRGEFSVAVAQFEAALKQEPKNAAALFHLGLIYTSQQQYQAATDAWNRYIKATNGSAGGYSNLGFCYELARQPQEAESAYKKGIAKEPQNQACRVNYGLMLARQRRISEATAQLQAVLSPAEVHYNLASVLESQGQREAARGEYQKSLQADPEMADAKARLAALGE